MKYIFMAGAPGSKWSSVAKNIYFSPDIDRSDASPDREYWHDASGTMQLMHMGAYFDPGMEFGREFDKLDQFSPEYIEQEFNRPFSGEGVRIVKSHVFAHHVGYLKTHWPKSPVVLIYRDSDACLGWWVRCGHFNITYPDYSEYYKDLKHMAREIDRQNADIVKDRENRIGVDVTNNRDLARVLGIAEPPEEYFQDYKLSDIKVKVI